MSFEILANPLRGIGLPDEKGMAEGVIETDVTAAAALYSTCPVNHATPLRNFETLCSHFGVGKLWLKLEESRMGLGSFKALGAVHAIAKQAAKKVGLNDLDAMKTALNGETYVCASAGNHGLSVAAGAALFGAKAVVLLADTVPEEFAVMLRGKNAEVIRAGANYEESMETSKELAKKNGWNLLSDGSWTGYSDPARDVMEGYLIMAHEVADEIPRSPSHVFLQAGVGGLAAACAAGARVRWGQDVKIVVVEPEAAPALMESVRAGKCVDTKGPDSSMGRLDCKTPSHLALKYLAKEADHFITLDDELVDNTVKLLASNGVSSSPSSAAGVAALHHLERLGDLGLDNRSEVLCYISEGAL